MTEDLESAGVGLASGAADGANREVDLDGDEPSIAEHLRPAAAGSPDERLWCRSLSVHMTALTIAAIRPHAVAIGRSES